MRALALTAALLILAGCLDSMERYFDKEEVSEDQVRDEADAAARAWKADAVFAGAFAFETREGEFGLDERAPLDPEPGNGRAVAWAFTYLAGDRMGTFVVNASGTTVMSDDSDAPDSDFAPIGEQGVSSDEAMATAREDARVETAVGNAKAIGIALGNNGTSGPLWTVFTLGSSEGIVAMVDARSGALLRVETWSMPPFGDWGDWSGLGSWGGGSGSSSPRERIVYEDTREGTLHPVNGAEEPFDAPPGATRVVLEVSGSSVALAPDIVVRLLDAGGQEVEPDEAEDGRYEYDLDFPGPYTVALRPAQASTTVMYELAITVWGRGGAESG